MLEPRERRELDPETRCLISPPVALKAMGLDETSKRGTQIKVKSQLAETGLHTHLDSSGGGGTRGGGGTSGGNWEESYQ